MGISLDKGGNINLQQQLQKDSDAAAAAAGTPPVTVPQLANVTVGLGWDQRTTTGTEFDVDASAIAVKADGKVLDQKFFVFYGNLASPDGTIQHTGDNLDGHGDGDDEKIKINLAGLPADVDKIVFPVTIHQANERGQNFGQVTRAFVRVVDDATGNEITRYDLSEDASTETAMVFGELYRNGADWKFRAVGQGSAAGLKGIAQEYGVNV